MEKYKKHKQQYIAYIQVGGALAKNYRRIIELLGVKSLIITDIDYKKEAKSIDDIKDSESTNATIKGFHKLDNPGKVPKVKDLYIWKKQERILLVSVILNNYEEKTEPDYIM